MFYWNATRRRRNHFVFQPASRDFLTDLIITRQPNNPESRNVVAAAEMDLVFWFLEEFGKPYRRIFVWWLVSLGGVTRGAWNAGNGAREWAWNAGEWAADCVWSMKRRRVNARICSFDAMIMLRTYAFRDYNSRNFNIGLPNLVYLFANCNATIQSKLNLSKKNGISKKQKTSET